jgi:hypothetical protein
MIRKILYPSLLLLVICSCTKLDEKFNGDLTPSQLTGSSTNAAALLAKVYTSISNPFQDRSQMYALTEITTDELIAPTRASDWDDNGAWRQLHLQRWDGTHIRLLNLFNNLNGVVFAATDLLQYNPSVQQQAEARFIRAWAMYWLLDMFDQAPYRDPGESVILASRVRKGMEAFNYIISEINAVKADLPDAPAGLANKDAAKVFLMKLYLNKAVYINRQSPVFAAVDMDSVITLADQIINSNKYSFTANYFDNFSPNNTVIGKENIWTEENVGGVTATSIIRGRWTVVMHYNQNPVGVNGWASTPDFYGKFEAADKRRGLAYNTTGGPANPGKQGECGFSCRPAIQSYQ